MVKGNNKAKHPLMPAWGRVARRILNGTARSLFSSRGKIAARESVLRNGRNGRDRVRATRQRRVVQVDLAAKITRRVLLRAFPGDVAGLTALITGLARCVEGAAVGSGAITRDVTELTASVALHRLRLAVTREVVRTTALVAGRGARTTGEPATSETETATAHGGAPAHHARRVGARPLHETLEGGTAIRDAWL